MEGRENDEQVRDEVIRSEEANSLISTSLCYFFHQLLKSLFKCFESEEETIINGVENTNVASSSSLKHEVFLSFRGGDTRSGFMSHLYAKLWDKKIETYMDDRLEKGDTISDALIEAIRSSKISVIVFSVNYATSSWCLDEVLCIVECMRERGQVVVPVFYKVDPTNVRRQSGSYEAAFKDLKSWGFGEKKVKQWRAALTQVANLSGWPSLDYRTESDFIDAIVEDILKKLKDMSSSDHRIKEVVGIEESVEGVKKLLQLDSSDVRIIGIWGMGGLGKTTLARVVFERLSSNFEGCCFLENVREKSGKLEGPEKLKKELFCELLEEKDIDHITNFHKERLLRKQVLIVLDDVDQPEQLDDLAGDQSWFGDGSRVIVTTRDEQVLRDRADEKYELRGLSFECSLELFNLNAFKRKSPTSDDIELSKRVVNYSKGIPLALKVIGRFLRSRRRENWEIELDRLKEVPNKIVQNALKISYDGLDEHEQRVFLDIVCFVEVGERTCRYYVERMLGGDRSLKRDIDSLIDKSLIFDNHNSLTTHDLIREMGSEIVRQQSIEEPGRRSRLISAQDCYHVFKNNTGTIVIEGISARYCYEVVELNPGVFEEMHKLRFLRIVASKVQPPQQLEYLPCSLKYLEWETWPLKSMPTNFSPSNLVELRMPHSKLERLWSGDQDLGNLKHVDLSHSDRLTEVSGLSQAPNLESVNLLDCTSLREVSSLRFGDFDKSYHKCDAYTCSTLGFLDLSYCRSLNVLSSIFGNVKELKLTQSLIEELPSSVTSLRNLASLSLELCPLLKNLPSDTQSLISLKRLNLYKCSSFVMLPMLPRNITWLNLSHTAIEQVPSESIENLSRLEELNLSSCKKLKHLPTNICKLKSLKRLTLDDCKQLEIFPEILEPMECLEVLSLKTTSIGELPSSVENLTGLREIHLSSSKICAMPTCLLKLKSLTTLDLSYCKISEIPNQISCLSSLEKLYLSENPIREISPGIQQLHNLKRLEIICCEALTSLPELPPAVEAVYAGGCTSLHSVPKSKDVSQREPWTVHHATRLRRFLYSYCSLDQITCTEMAREFQLRVLRTAATFVSNNGERNKALLGGSPDIGICLPGEEIPKWFTYRSERSSIHVKLPSQWHSADFLGFAFCAVVGVPFLDCRSSFSLRTSDGKGRRFDWDFRETNDSVAWPNDSGYNMFMWYKYENYDEYHDAVDAFLNMTFGYRPHFYPPACGVRLLYCQDYEEEFGRSNLMSGTIEPET